MKLYLNNFYETDTSTCDYCVRLVRFMCELFDLPENFDGIMEKRNFGRGRNLVYQIDDSVEGEETVVTIARTPNQVRELLKDFGIINVPENDIRMTTNLSLEFLNRNWG